MIVAADCVIADDPVQAIAAPPLPRPQNESAIRQFSCTGCHDAKQAGQFGPVIEPDIRDQNKLSASPDDRLPIVAIFRQKPEQATSECQPLIHGRRTYNVGTVLGLSIQDTAALL
jgi:hypothetical protein